MQAPNRKRQSPSKMKQLARLFVMMATQLITGGASKESANKMAFHQVYMGGGSAEYYPKKHTVQSYRSQQRQAKRRRRAR